MCRYLVIRSDDQFTQHLATSAAAALLTTIPLLRQVSPATYQGVDETVLVLLLQCDRDGNYASFSDRPSPDIINRVELVCSCQGPQRDLEWEALANRIAEILSWEVVDDETDETLHPRPGHTDGTADTSTSRPPLGPDRSTCSGTASPL